ncbi:MAG: class C sortase [Clostridia bacterium]|nr:class C sortase [Clostridia bacterium]
MKKRSSTVIIIIVFLIGLGLMLYPTVSNYVNNMHQSVAINSYEKQVAQMSRSDFRKILSDARDYNLDITSNEFPRNKSDLEGNESYHKAMNPSGNGMMGYLKIDAIKLRLPIYHTTRESVLQSGVGHIPTTSLPVGGKGTHAVLSGHRGLPSAKLFTDLDKVQIGDVFYIYILDDILAYEVDQIKTVTPTDTKDLQIIKGEDHVTLVTCTPYGVNTHRLLIRGTRVPYDETVAEAQQIKSEERKSISAEQIAVYAGAPALTVLFLAVLLLRRKKKKKEVSA